MVQLENDNGLISLRQQAPGPLGERPIEKGRDDGLGPVHEQEVGALWQQDPEKIHVHHVRRQEDYGQENVRQLENGLGA